MRAAKNLNGQSANSSSAVGERPDSRQAASSAAGGATRPSCGPGAPRALSVATRRKPSARARAGTPAFSNETSGSPPSSAQRSAASARRAPLRRQPAQALGRRARHAPGVGLAGRGQARGAAELAQIASRAPRPCPPRRSADRPGPGARAPRRRRDRTAGAPPRGPRPCGRSTSPPGWRRAARASSRRMGSSRIWRGKSFSLRPSRITARKRSPRASIASSARTPSPPAPAGRDRARELGLERVEEVLPRARGREPVEGGQLVQSASSTARRASASAGEVSAGNPRCAPISARACSARSDQDAGGPPSESRTPERKSQSAATSAAGTAKPVPPSRDAARVELHGPARARLELAAPLQPARAHSERRDQAPPHRDARRVRAAAKYGEPIRSRRPCAPESRAAAGSADRARPWRAAGAGSARRRPGPAAGPRPRRPRPARRGRARACARRRRSRGARCRPRPGAPPPSPRPRPRRARRRRRTTATRLGSDLRRAPRRDRTARRARRRARCPRRPDARGRSASRPASLTSKNSSAKRKAGWSLRYGK